MYDSHFGLSHRPFTAIPDSGCYYPAARHEEALSGLSKGLELGEGLALLTGGPGLGKTLLVHCLVERLDPGIVPVVLTGARLRDASALLQAILFDQGLPYGSRSEQELRLTFMDALLKTYKAGGRTVLVVDEAHHLRVELLEELRLLGNLEARGGKALQIVLVGLPPILASLRRPELAALRQRLVVRTTLEAWSRQESLDFMAYAVRRAGGVLEQLFSAEALDLLTQETRGVPRLLNQAAHQALLLAWQSETSAVDVEAAHGALEILGLVDSTAVDEHEAEIAEEGQNAGELLPLTGGAEPGLEEMPGISPRCFAAPTRTA